jgi:hypothetical protein
MPKNFVILGSNDDNTWTLLKSVTGGTAVEDVYHDLVINADRSYKYFVWLVSAITGTGGELLFGNIKYYGHKEGDLTRFPEPTRVLKYPHIAMTGPGQRGYVVTASSFQQAPYLGFTPATSGQAWVSGNTTDYDGANNDYNATTYRLGGSNTEYGEWLKLELPHKLAVNKMILTADPGGTYGINEAPDAWKIYGSNDDTNWVELLSVTGATPTISGDTRTISNSTAYKYLAIVLTSVNIFTAYTRVGQLEYYGTEENTGTPAIVGGPFAGKVANFRVYDQYLGDERIQEIYDAQKDEFGHKKSSMTFYKGRVGVGTTEPEGALTVIDEPHALAKFPARAVSADDSYVEGDGQIKLSAADGTGYQAFDGLTSTSWDSAPTRHTRVSEEVDFGAWLKIQTPESVSLKKAEFESNPDWRQVGSDINGSALNDQLGRAVACSHDGTRIIAGGHAHNGNAKGMARVYDWNGTTWELIGNQTLTGTADLDKFGSYVAISGDGNIIAVAAPFEHVGGDVDKGIVRVYYLVGGQWTILPDSGTLTSDVDTFVGSAANMFLGNGPPKLSYDGKTIAMCEYGYDISGKNDVGRVLVYKYSNGAWSYKGTGATQFVGDATDGHFGFGMSMSEDGDHLALGTRDDAHFVEVYKWDGSSWNIKGSRISESGLNGNDDYGSAISISNDGNTLAVGARNADLADGARGAQSGLVFVYHWTGSAWGTPHKLQYDEAADEDFGISVELSGDGKRLIVAASAENSSSGELFTFEYTGTSWIMRTANVSGAGGGTSGHLGYGPDGDAHAVAISRDGSTIVGGELGYNSGFVNSGRVRVFSMPSTIKSIWGSNDDVNWTKITTGNKTFRDNDRLEFKNLDNPNYYKYHAIVADAFTRLKDVKLFGIRNQGSSTLHDGALTLTKNLDVPRIGPPLDADDTPRRDRLVVEYNTSTNPVEDGVVRDTSGRGNDGVFYNGASYDASAKAFEFNGTNDYTTFDVSTASGDWVHSVSLWVYMDSLSTKNTFFHGDLGGTTINSTINYRVDTDGTIVSAWYGNNQTWSEVLQIGRWYHIVLVYPGGGADKQRLYVDGDNISVSVSASTTQLNINYTDFTIGANYSSGATNPLDGSISNFKLYDTVLTAQEVKTLYDMGRTGSVANPQPLHIAAPLYSPGTIVQVEQAVTTNLGISTTSTSPTDITGLIITIHPKFANSKILVSYQLAIGSNFHSFVHVKRTQNGVTSLDVGRGAGSGNRQRASSYVSHVQVNHICSENMEFLDSANGIDPITYQIQMWVASSSYTFILNRPINWGNNAYYGSLSSTLTVKEICQ